MSVICACMRPEKYRMVLGNMSRLPLSCPRMRKQSLLLLATLVVAAPLFAEDDEKKAPQPVENLYFATDEYIAIPKYTFSYGYRALSGSKATFSGTSRIYNTAATLFDLSTTKFTEASMTTARIYDDGSVGVDTRSDGTGRPLVSDGTTNTWTYEHASQVADGLLNFHSYSADVVDSGGREKALNNTYGLEVNVSHDMVKLGRRLLWTLGAGISLNDINQKMSSSEAAVVTTRISTYDLNGYAPSDPGTSNPSTKTITMVGPDGVLSGNTTTPNTTAFIGQNPVQVVTTTTTGTVTNFYKLKGAYYTIRFGPTFIVPVTAKFRFSLGVGAALVYTGTEYTVETEFLPTSEESIISKKDAAYEKNLLPGYYLDANLEYWLTERTGLYAGGIFQSSSSYNQQILVDGINLTNYSTRVDLSTQTGFRCGMNYRF